MFPSFYHISLITQRTAKHAHQAACDNLETNTDCKSTDLYSTPAASVPCCFSWMIVPFITCSKLGTKLCCFSIQVQREVFYTALFHANWMQRYKQPPIVCNHTKEPNVKTHLWAQSHRFSWRADFPVFTLFFNIDIPDTILRLFCWFSNLSMVFLILS